MATTREAPSKRKARPKTVGSTRGAANKGHARKVVLPTVRETRAGHGSTASKIATPSGRATAPPSLWPNASAITYFNYDSTGHMTPVDSLGQPVNFAPNATYTYVPLAHHHVTYFTYDATGHMTGVASTPEPRDVALEIDVIGGRRVRVIGDVDGALLAKVVTVLESLAR